VSIPYPVVPFRQKINGITIRRKGYQIGDCLVVSFTLPDDDRTWSIFNSLTMNKVIPNQFTTFEDAKLVAELLRDIFGEYWLINEVWAELDIVRCACWSVKGGVQTHLALASLENQDIITISDVKQAWANNQDKAQELTRKYVTA
jgi:hypothetical protein